MVTTQSRSITVSAARALIQSSPLDPKRVRVFDGDSLGGPVGPSSRISGGRAPIGNCTMASVYIRTVTALGAAARQIPPGPRPVNRGQRGRAEPPGVPGPLPSESSVRVVCQLYSPSECCRCRRCHGPLAWLHQRLQARIR
jgi:hypothetical protein